MILGLTNTLLSKRKVGGFVGLLDLFPNAAAAYSLRKLRAAYSGAAVRVRESGGNTEADIGFTSAGELDTSALLAHCGANDGFVTVWYDQSLSNDATQTTASNQPKIVSAGSLVTENAKAAIQFDGVDDFVSKATPTLGTSIDNLTSFVVAKYDATALSASALYGATNSVNYGTSNSAIIARQLSGNDTFVANNSFGFTSPATAGASTTNQTLFYHQFIGSTEVAIGRNGGSLSKNTSSIPANVNLSLKLEIGGITIPSVGNPMNGIIQEFVLFSSNQSANRTPIETNINNFYSIYP